MQTKIAVEFAAVVLFGVLTGSAAGQTNQVDAPPAVQQPAEKPAPDLVTRSGTVYKNFHVEKAGPSGLTISYTPDDGGIGVSQIPFDNLPDEIQQHYSYDPKTAVSSEAAGKPPHKAAVPAPAPPPALNSGS